IRVSSADLNAAPTSRETVITWGLRVRVASSKRDEVERILRGLTGPARVRGGCLTCRIYRDIEDPGALALIQEWASWDPLERYLRSEDYPKLLAVIESAAQQPEIWFDTIATREGLERLAATRGASVPFDQP
ncbi:MAG: putative quinol monooxygenase, partial [Candidatus Rokuibacteriota bacterium]